jgi:catechol 2,3-dioxygenase-like lactoylglutathione lyase family enzyme
MSAAIEFTPSHLGICVENIERSLRFYCDGLGFEKGEGFAIGNEYRAALEVEGEVVLTSQFIRRGTLAIELLAYRSPGAIGAPSTRRNQLGFTHLSFNVSDVDAAARSLVACGGRLLAGTRTGAGDPGAVQIVFLADPDGVRIELIAQPEPSAGA